MAVTQAATLSSTLEVGSTSTLTGDVTFGGNIVADADEAKAIFAAVTTPDNKITLGGGGTVKTAGDLEIAGGDIRATNSTWGVNMFTDTTARVSVGGGAVKLSNAGSATTVDGTLVVSGTDDVSGSSESNLTAAVQINGGCAVHKHLHTIKGLTVGNYPQTSQVEEILGHFYRSDANNSEVRITSASGKECILGMYELDTSGTDGYYGMRVVYNGSHNKLFIQGVENKNVATTIATFVRGSNCMGLNTFSPSTSYKLDVNGGVRCTSLTETSDLTLKQDVRDIADVERLQAVRPVTWEWKEADLDGGERRRHAGVVAQELETIIPEAVNTDAETGIKSVEYSHLIALLIKSNQQLTARVAALEARVAAAEGEA